MTNRPNLEPVVFRPIGVIRTPFTNTAGMPIQATAAVGIPGWIDLDPTNNLMPQERHITVAWGRDFGDVSPLRGVFIGSGTHQLQVAVDVIPLSAD